MKLPRIPNEARVWLSEAAQRSYDFSSGVVKGAEKVGANWWYRVLDDERKSHMVRGEHLRQSPPEGEGP